jgi:ribosomal-protein-alanine N-acetyltransferase
MNLFIRPMDLEDIPQASEIEREAFPPPWPATNFRRELTINSLTFYLVAYEELCDDEKPVPGLRNTNCDMPSSESSLDTLRSIFRRFFGGRAAGVAPRQLILGFAGLWFMADEAHLANIAVRESYRQQGVGERLLISAIKLAMEHNANIITLEVRASNRTARALYKKYGFAEVGIRPAYYTDNKEDAVLMTADGITSASFTDNFLMLCQAHTPQQGDGL